jgi:urease accessory protein
MLTPLQFVHALQLADSFFPVGAFAYSDGLETAAANGSVHDAESLRIWMNHFLGNVFVPCDGLALLKCAEAFRRGDFETIRGIDDELTAIKPSAAVRNASRSVGKRLLAAYSDISRDRHFTTFVQTLPQSNAPVAYAVVMTHRGLDSREALLAFGYSRLAGIVSAGLRLISMGQQQAQNLLAEQLERLPDAVERIVQMESEPLRSFAPLMDIAQMNHRYVYSRLFRS